VLIEVTQCEKAARLAISGIFLKRILQLNDGFRVLLFIEVLLAALKVILRSNGRRSPHGICKHAARQDCRNQNASVQNSLHISLRFESTQKPKQNSRPPLE